MIGHLGLRKENSFYQVLKTVLQYNKLSARNSAGSWYWYLVLEPVPSMYRHPYASVSRCSIFQILSFSIAHFSYRSNQTSVCSKYISFGFAYNHIVDHGGKIIWYGLKNCLQSL